MKKEDLITTAQAGALIGCTDESIRNYRRRGWLTPMRLPNGRILFVRQQVERLRETLLAKRRKMDQPELVQASQDAQAWRKQSLRVDPDPIIFKPEVWKALAEYEASKRGRREA